MHRQIRANAKVNLCLAVHYPPEDGYHRVSSVFQEIDLHDTLAFDVVEGQQQEDDGPRTATRMGTPVALACDVPGLDVRDNLIFKALDRAEEEFGLEAVPRGYSLRIRVEKHIPAGGGLGGGSADAAAALKFFAAQQRIDVHDEHMLRVAHGLGADVAFFLHGGAALMEGRGDVFVRELPVFPGTFVLMGDASALSTVCVYAAFDDNPAPAPDAVAFARAMSDPAANARALASLCGNNLEPAACALQAGLAERIKRAQDDPDVLKAMVSGSGATSLAVCANVEAAQRFAARAAAYCDWAVLANPCLHSQ